MASLPLVLQACLVLVLLHTSRGAPGNMSLPRLPATPALPTTQKAETNIEKTSSIAITGISNKDQLEESENTDNSGESQSAPDNNNAKPQASLPNWFSSASQSETIKQRKATSSDVNQVDASQTIGGMSSSSHKLELKETAESELMSEMNKKASSSSGTTIDQIKAYKKDTQVNQLERSFNQNTTEGSQSSSENDKGSEATQSDLVQDSSDISSSTAKTTDIEENASELDDKTKVLEKKTSSATEENQSEIDDGSLSSNEKKKDGLEGVTSSDKFAMVQMQLKQTTEAKRDENGKESLTSAMVASEVSSNMPKAPAFPAFPTFPDMPTPVKPATGMDFGAKQEGFFKDFSSLKKSSKDISKGTEVSTAETEQGNMDSTSSVDLTKGTFEKDQNTQSEELQGKDKKSTDVTWEKLAQDSNGGSDRMKSAISAFRKTIQQESMSSASMQKLVSEKTKTKEQLPPSPPSTSNTDANEVSETNGEDSVLNETKGLEEVTKAEVSSSASTAESKSTTEELKSRKQVAVKEKPVAKIKTKVVKEKATQVSKSNKESTAKTSSSSSSQTKTKLQKKETTDQKKSSKKEVKKFKPKPIRTTTTEKPKEVMPTTTEEQLLMPTTTTTPPTTMSTTSESPHLVTENDTVDMSTTEISFHTTEVPDEKIPTTTEAIVETVTEAVVEETTTKKQKPISVKPKNNKSILFAISKSSVGTIKKTQMEHKETKSKAKEEEQISSTKIKKESIRKEVGNKAKEAKKSSSSKSKVDDAEKESEVVDVSELWYITEATPTGGNSGGSRYEIRTSNSKEAVEEYDKVRLKFKSLQASESSQKLRDTVMASKNVEEEAQVTQADESEDNKEDVIENSAKKPMAKKTMEIFSGESTQVFESQIDDGKGMKKVKVEKKAASVHSTPVNSKKKGKGGKKKKGQRKSQKKEEEELKNTKSSTSAAAVTLSTKKKSEKPNDADISALGDPTPSRKNGSGKGTISRTATSAAATNDKGVFTLVEGLFKH